MNFGTWHHSLHARQLCRSDIFAPFGLVVFLGFAPLAFDFTLSAARQTVLLDLRALSNRAGAYNAASNAKSRGKDWSISGLKTSGKQILYP